MRVDWRKVLTPGEEGPGSLRSYLIAIICVAVAAASHLSFAHFIDDITPSVPYYAAIFIAALFGGVRAGISAVVLSAVLAWWAFDSQYFGHRASGLTETVNRGLYVAAAALIIWTAERFRRNRHDAEVAEAASTPQGETAGKTASVAARRLPDLRRAWREGLTPNSPAAYAFALIVIAFATLLRAGFAWVGDSILPFACYYPALLVVALIGGTEAALFAMVLSLFAVWWAFDSQYPAFGRPTRDEIVSFALYLFASMLTVWLAESYRRVLRHLAAQETRLLDFIGPVVVSFAAVLVTTLALLTAETHLEAEHLVIGFLLPITLIAIQYGSSLAFLTSLASALAAAYFLFPPKFSLYIANPLHVAELVLFTVIALIASKIVSLLTYDDRRQPSAWGPPKRRPLTPK